MKINKIEKMAVIGTGYFSQYHFDAWKAQSKCCWSLFFRY